MMNDSCYENMADSVPAINTTDSERIPAFLTQRIVQQICYGMIFVLSMAGNAAMLAVLLHRGTRLLSRKDILLLNMIVAESAVAITSIPLDFTLLFLNDGWLFGPFMCHILWPMQTAPFGALVLTLTAMSIQRYKGIVHQMRSRNAGRKSSFATVIFIWLFSLIIVVPYGVFLRLEEGQCSETWGEIGSQVYTVGLFAFHYVIPLTIITFCYARIAIRIRHGQREGASIISGTHKARLKRSRRHVRAMRMVILFVVVFAVCMLPHQVVWLWITFGKEVNYSDNLLTFAYMFTFTSSFANPLVYFTQNPALKAKLKSLILCRLTPDSRLRTGNSFFTTSDDASADSRVWAISAAWYIKLHQKPLRTQSVFIALS